MRPGPWLASHIPGVAKFGSYAGTFDAEGGIDDSFSYAISGTCTSRDKPSTEIFDFDLPTVRE